MSIYTLSSLPNEDGSRCWWSTPVNFPHARRILQCFYSSAMFRCSESNKQTCCWRTACKQRCNRRCVYLQQMKLLRIWIKHFGAKHSGANVTTSDKQLMLCLKKKEKNCLFALENMEINPEHARLIQLPVFGSMFVCMHWICVQEALPVTHVNSTWRSCSKRKVESYIFAAMVVVIKTLIHVFFLQGGKKTTRIRLSFIVCRAKVARVMGWHAPAQVAL